MSKRIFAILMLLLMLLSYTSCNSKADNEYASAGQIVSKNDNQGEQSKTEKPLIEDEKQEEGKEDKKEDLSEGKEKTPIAQEEYDYDEIDAPEAGNEEYDSETGTLYINGKGKVEEHPINYYPTIKKIVFCEGITEISYCFRGSSYSLETIEFPSTLKKISNSFSTLEIEYLKIPKTVERISFCSFESSAIQKLEFEGALEIDKAFHYLKELEFVLIPKGSVCRSSFILCADLKEVVLEKNVRLEDYKHFLYEDEDDPFVENPLVTEYSFGSCACKAYLYLPTDGENHPWGEGGKYKPIVVSDGEDWKDYRDVPMTLKETS